MPEIIKLSSKPTREYWEIPVLLEDGQLLALDKPSHLLTSPDRHDPERPNLMRLLHRDIQRKAPWVQSRSLAYLANAHRLDFETSGVILLAKDKPTLVRLANLFGAEQTTKTYWALVQGHPEQDRFEVTHSLGPHPTKVGLMRVDRKFGKRARTEFEAVERFGRMTLVRCRPFTGRTHQIRVHLQSARLPIVGDSLYGGRPLLLSSLKPNYRQKRDIPERPLMGRVALHAASLTLDHPATGLPVTIEAPLPKDFTVALKYLRRFAGTNPPAPPSIEPEAPA